MRNTGKYWICRWRTVRVLEFNDHNTGKITYNVFNSRKTRWTDTLSLDRFCVENV